MARPAYLYLSELLSDLDYSLVHLVEEHHEESPHLVRLPYLLAHSVRDLHAVELLQPRKVLKQESLVVWVPIHEVALHTEAFKRAGVQDACELFNVLQAVV